MAKEDMTGGVLSAGNKILEEQKTKEGGSELYDFYYSAEQEKLKKELKKHTENFPDNQYPPTVFTIHGRPYTEKIKKGKKPMGNFNDYELVYSEEEKTVEK